MPTLIIDGREVRVDRGTTILQAAQELGIEVPTFCYHPGLSVPANCRMCLVELVGKDPNRPPPKPQPACYTQVADGMEVRTTSDLAKKKQQAVLEFILLNHPVDCPICDQAGECVLQDHYFRYSAQASRLAHKKVNKPKVKVLGPNVILDGERCIVCTRCVRFMEEIAKNPQLTVLHRGEHAEISTFPGIELDDEYATNTVDICPVGALTSREFRFRTRVWMMQSAESVCPECSRGCKIRVDTFENVVRRYKPLYNPEVNDWWMCDSGRRSYKDYLDGRMPAPTMMVGKKRVATTTAKALEAALEAINEAGSSDRLGVVVSPWATNEDAFILARLLGRGGVLSGAHVYMGGRAAGEGDNVLRQGDANPNRLGVETIFGALGVTTEPLFSFDPDGLETLIVFGDNHAMDADQLNAVLSVPRMVVIGAFRTPLWQHASVFLPQRLFWERTGTWTNFSGQVQRFHRAVKSVATCKSDGWYAMKIGAALGAEMRYNSPLDIFTDLASQVPAFAGMTYSTLEPYGLTLGSGAAAVADQGEGAEQQATGGQRAEAP